MIRYGFILAIICVIAAGLLGFANLLTRPKILEQAKMEEAASLKEVMPQAASFNPVTAADKTTLYYRASDSQGNLIGFVFKASGKGYSSIIETLVGMFIDGRISAIKVISQNETPGLGIRITEPDFTGQFKSKMSQDLSGVQAISGATISSRAVMNSIISKAEEIKGLIENEK